MRRVAEKKFKKGDYVVGIMGINGGRVFMVTNVHSQSNRDVVVLQDVLSNKHTDTYAYNLKEVTQSNYEKLVSSEDYKNWIEKHLKSIKVASDDIVVYKFPNGFRSNAESMLKQLLNDGLTPKFEYRKGDMVLKLPKNQVKHLQTLQKVNPARYGNLQNYKLASIEITANQASNQYREKFIACQYALSNISKALEVHKRKQEQDKENYGYVGDLNYIHSQLRDIAKSLM